MSRRGENINKRKDGRWEARVKVLDSDNKSYKYVSLYGKTYSEAKEKKLNFLLNQTRQNICKNSKTMAYVLDMWLYNIELNIKNTTKQKYVFLIEKHIKPSIGSIEIRNINNEVVNKLIRDKFLKGNLLDHGGLSSSYIRTMIYIIKSAVAFASNKNMCKRLDDIITIPKKDVSKVKIMDLEDYITLEKIIFSNYSLTGLGIALSLNAGLRLGEVCALSWKDIDFDNNIIFVNHTVSRIMNENTSGNKTKLVLEKPKTSSSIREIPITSKLIPYICEIRKNSNSEFVISDKKNFINPRTYEYRFHKYLEENNISQINYHALRHTFATKCIESGMDIKTLSELMGHSDITITLNTYVHSSLERKRDQIEKLSVNRTL